MPGQPVCREVTFLGPFTPSDPKLPPQTIRSPQPRCAHPQEVRGQAPSQPVHDVEEKEAADGVEELTWERESAHPVPPPLFPLSPVLPCPDLCAALHSLHFPGLAELVTMAVMAGKTDRVTVKTNTRHSAVSQICKPGAGVWADGAVGAQRSPKPPVEPQPSCVSDPR